MNELQTVDKIKATTIDGKFGTNSVEVGKQLDEALKKYNFEILTDDDLKKATKMRTELRKVRDEVNEAIKCIFADVKNEEAIVKINTLKKIDEVEKCLKARIDDAEDKIFKAKVKMAEEHWKSLTDKYPFELVYQSKWKNKAETEKKIKDYLDNQFKSFEKLKEFVDGMAGSFSEEEQKDVEQIFYETADVNACKSYLDDRTIEKANKLREEAERKALEEKIKSQVLQEQVIRQENERIKVEANKTPIVNVTYEQNAYTINMDITATDTQFKMLRQFMMSNGIKFVEEETPF